MHSLAQSMGFLMSWIFSLKNTLKQELSLLDLTPDVI